MANEVIAKNLRLKRAYAPPAADGARILVERLWPRGISKERAALDDRLKDIAPSPALRTWFHHDPARWPEFQKRYRAELGRLLAQSRERAAHDVVTLIYASRAEERNGARVLYDVLLGK